MQEIKNEIIEYVNRFSEIVGSTFGPGGFNVLISNDGGDFLTKDGVTVARNLHTNNPLEKSVWNLMKEACEKTVSSCGDGTTTTAILTSAFYNNMIRVIDSGTNRPLLFKELDRCLEILISELTKEVYDIKNYGDIFRVALLSSNNDKELAKLVADTLEFIGIDGSVKIEESKTHLSHTSISDGYHYNSGYSSYEFCNTNKHTCELEDPLILVYNGRLNFGSDFKNTIETLVLLNKPIVLVADEFDEKVLSTLIYNKNKSGIKILAINAPYFGVKKKNSLEDLSVMVGASLFDDSLLPLSLLKSSEHLGTCKMVTSSKFKTLFIDCNFNDAKYDSWIEKLKSDMTEAEDDRMAQELTYRISQLSASAIIIYLAGNTPAEILEKRHRLEDALSSATTAVRGGVVVAGGGPLIRALSNIKLSESEFVYGLMIDTIFKQTIYSLYDRLYDNLSARSHIIRSKLLVSNIFEYCDYNTHELSDSKEFIEPYLTIKQSLSYSLSISKLLLSVKAYVLNKTQQ